MRWIEGVLVMMILMDVFIYRGVHEVEHGHPSTSHEPQWVCACPYSPSGTFSQIMMRDGTWGSGWAPPSTTRKSILRSLDEVVMKRQPRDSEGAGRAGQSDGAGCRLE